MQVAELARALHEANGRWEEDQASLEKMQAQHEQEQHTAAVELQQLAAASSRIRWEQSNPQWPECCEELPTTCTPIVPQLGRFAALQQPFTGHDCCVTVPGKRCRRQSSCRLTRRPV